MGSVSERLTFSNWPRGCSSVKVDCVSLPSRVALRSWGAYFMLSGEGEKKGQR